MDFTFWKDNSYLLNNLLGTWDIKFLDCLTTELNVQQMFTVNVRRTTPCLPAAAAHVDLHDDILWLGVGM